MTDATRKKVVFGILGLAVIYGATSIDWSSSRKPTDYVETPDSNGQIETSRPKRPALVINIDSVLATPWGGDPFRLADRVRSETHQDEEPLGWKLSGIVFIPGKAMAVINSRPVKEGDIINDASVVKIEKDAVTLELRGNRFTIGVNEG